MPRHHSGELSRPVADNARLAAHHAPKMTGKGRGVPQEGKPSRSPQATSLPGSLSIIKDMGSRHDGARGIPGIISSTLTSPETRQRLVSGVLDTMIRGETPSGPVHSVAGHDSTAWNAGMAHISGSRFK
jgi:hypothetical protein